MRLCEASCLLAPELPGERAAVSGLGAIHLGPAVTKRARARTVFTPPRLVRALDRYVRFERGEMVARISAGGGYALGGQALAARRAGRTGVSLDGGAVAYGRLDPGARRRLLLVTPEGEVAGPLALWLSADGLPVAPATWQSVFARANARCERLGIGVSVTRMPCAMFSLLYFRVAISHRMAGSRRVWGCPGPCCVSMVSPHDLELLLVPGLGVLGCRTPPAVAGADASADR